MLADWQRDLVASAHDFRHVIWPAIKPLCEGGDLYQNEGAPNALPRAFDTLAGIDAWQVVPDVGLRGIASRVQWLDGALPTRYRTFTVRKSRDSGALTEYAKRLRSLENPRGWAYPHLTIHGYVLEPKGQSGALLGAAVARTADVIRLIRDGSEGRDWYTQRTGNADFYVVRWARLLASDLPIRIVPETLEQTMRCRPPRPAPKTIGARERLYWQDKAEQLSLFYGLPDYEENEP